MNKLKIHSIFDSKTSTLTYVVYDPSTKDGIVIDPVLDFDEASGEVSTQSINRVSEFVNSQLIKVHYILETHAHADHLSGAKELKNRHLFSAQIAIGQRICEVQKIFKKIFNFGDEFKTDGRQFDRLLRDGEEVRAGSLNFQVIYTPGHTPACASYFFKDSGILFTGDSLFMPDFGTGRCDFPAGDAKTLYHSISQKIYQLPDDTEVYVGHDYQPGGRGLAFMTTISESKTKNIHLRFDTTESEFVKFRSERDASLSAPKLLLPSIQVNIAAGEFPAPESNGVSYLKLPISRAVQT